MDPMDTYDEALEDDSLAPLKRNHACLQCKKRKVKCDGSKPNCAPCMRSHAHAVRAANRAGARPPILHCEWADSDSPNASPGRDDSAPVDVGVTQQTQAASTGSKKKVSGGTRKPSLEKEKARRQEDEKDSLLARIAELEARLAGLTPPSSESAGASSSTSNSASNSSFNNTSPIQPINNMSTPPEMNWDFSSFFMVPAHWPKNLPAPYLLEHLVDTFFTCVPQAPRMLNRAKLMARLKLPPNHNDFPHASLLHAICATAAQYTAWVTSLPAPTLDAAIMARQARGEDFETFEDFAIAQAEATRRCIHHTHQMCQVGSPNSVFEILQAEVLVSDVWLCRGMYLKGWSEGGLAVRFVKGLELTNRNFPKRYKSGILPPPSTDVEREERLLTTWKTFFTEAVSGVSRYWPLSLDDREMFCRLPAAAIDFNRKDGVIPENPQDAKDPRLYTEHPVHDAFVLNCKVAMLCSRVSRFVRDWTQRDVRQGDSLLGMHLQIFKDIVRDIQDFQRTIPEVFKNVFRWQNQNQLIDSELLALHIVPNIAILMLYEPFASWDEPHLGGLAHMHKAYEAIMGVLHLVPSNLDVSLILTSDLSSARVVADLIKHALSKQSYGLAVRYRADFSVIQSLMARYGQKHPLGQYALSFLENYLEGVISGKDVELCPRTVLKSVSTGIDNFTDSSTTLPTIDSYQSLFDPNPDLGLPNFPSTTSGFISESFAQLPDQTLKSGFQPMSTDQDVFLSADFGAQGLELGAEVTDSYAWSLFSGQGVQNP